jgi:hypothetical protein
MSSSCCRAQPVSVGCGDWLARIRLGFVTLSEGSKSASCSLLGNAGRWLGQTHHDNWLPLLSPASHSAVQARQPNFDPSHLSASLILSGAVSSCLFPLTTVFLLSAAVSSNHRNQTSQPRCDEPPPGTVTSFSTYTRLRQLYRQPASTPSCGLHASDNQVRYYCRPVCSPSHSCRPHVAAGDSTPPPPRACRDEEILVQSIPTSNGQIEVYAE